MEQRPPILQWKVVLALVGVVAIGVTLGSVLHTVPKSENKVYAFATLQRATPDVFGQVPTNQCEAFKTALRNAPPASKPTLRMLMKGVCHKRR